MSSGKGDLIFKKKWSEYSEIVVYRPMGDENENLH